MIQYAFFRMLRRCPIWLCYLLLASSFALPLLLGLRTFSDGDFTHHFLPFSLFQQDALRNGQLPLWNPHTYSGHPFLADTQAAVYYPISNLLLLLTLPWDGPGARLYWLQVEAMIHLALAGWFTFLLVRSLTDNRWAALVAGCSFAFSGYLTGYPPLQLAVLRTAIWLPLLLWALLHAMRSATLARWWIGAALIYVTMFFAGHPQTFLHSSYVMGFWVFWLLWQHHSQGMRPRLIGLVIFWGLALLLSAAQLWPSIEFTRLSVRANVDYSYVSGGFPLQDTWQLLLPGVLTHFSPLYIGVIGLGFAVVGGLTRRSTAHFFVFVGVLFLLLSYGQNGFLYPLFYRFVPGWQLFRGQERAAFVVALSLSILAGYGAAALPMLSYRMRRLLAIIIAMLISTGVYTFGLFWQLPGQSAVSQLHYLVVAIGTILCGLVLVVAIVLPGWEWRRMGVLTAALLANLFVVTMGTNLSEFGPVRKTILAPEMEAVEGAVTTKIFDGDGLPGRVYNEFRLYEDYAMRQELEDVWGSSPLRLARYAALFDNFPLDRMWRLTGVEIVLTWRQELFMPSTLLAEFPQTTDTTYLHRLSPGATKVNPRTWMVSTLRPATDDEMRTALADHNVDLGAIALLPFDALDREILASPGEHEIVLTRLSPQELRVHIRSEQGGLLVLSENWMPGWRVTDVVCLPATLLCARTTSADALPLFTPIRTNLTFLGVVVPAGEMTFVLRYQPLSVYGGLTISSVSMLLLLIFCLWRWRQVAK